MKSFYSARIYISLSVLFTHKNNFKLNNTSPACSVSSQAPLLGLEVVNVVVDDFVVVVILRTLRNKYLHVMAVDGDNFISNDWLQQFKYLTLIDFLTVF